MSIFDAGFIMWGFFLIYALFIIAYYGWLAARNRKDRRLQEDKTRQGGRQQ